MSAVDAPLSPPATQAPQSGPETNTAGEGSVTVAQHPHFYYPISRLGNDEAVILQVGKYVYRLSKFILCENIKFFDDTLHLPQGPQNIHEGKSDEYPIEVPGINEEAFDFILALLFGKYQQTPKLDALLSGLEFSMQWCIPALRAYAIDHLNPLVQRNEVHPALALSFARRHGITTWIEPALTRLKGMSLSSWSSRSDIMSWMSLDTYQVVARFRERLHERRASLALRGPEAEHDDGCKDKVTCQGAWEMTWMARAGEKLLNPDDDWRPSIREIKRCAENMDVPEMTPACYRLSMYVLTNSRAWDFEEHAVKKAVSLLMVEEVDVSFTPGGEPMDI